MRRPLFSMRCMPTVNLISFKEVGSCNIRYLNTAFSFISSLQLCSMDYVWLWAFLWVKSDGVIVVGKESFNSFAFTVSMIEPLQMKLLVVFRPQLLFELFIIEVFSEIFLRSNIYWLHSDIGVRTTFQISWWMVVLEKWILNLVDTVLLLLLNSRYI